MLSFPNPISVNFYFSRIIFLWQILSVSQVKFQEIHTRIANRIASCSRCDTFGLPKYFGSVFRANPNGLCKFGSDTLIWWGVRQAEELRRVSRNFKL